MVKTTNSHNVPILEFDPSPQSIIEPSQLVKPGDVPEHAVICFFAEVIEKVVAEHKASVIYTSHSEIGDHPVYEITYQSQRLAFYHPGVGAPLVVGLTEEVIALGLKKFVACGGCGVLDRNIALGHILLPYAAFRDEGTSYHYVPPAREIYFAKDVLQILEATLVNRGVPYMRTKCWTTDAFYRETSAKAARYLAEGCLAVEMEASALVALANFRGVKFGQYLYGGDAVLQEGWDGRNWNSRHQIREELFWLSVEACFKL